MVKNFSQVKNMTVNVVRYVSLEFAEGITKKFLMKVLKWFVLVKYL